MDSDLLRIICALATVVLPLLWAWFIVGRQSAAEKRRKKDI